MIINNIIFVYYNYMNQIYIKYLILNKLLMNYKFKLTKISVL